MCKTGVVHVFGPRLQLLSVAPRVRRIYGKRDTESLSRDDESDRIVGEHFLHKLITRNENIMGSNHPWKAKISAALGKTAKQRQLSTTEHYNNVCSIHNWNYWRGDANYSPDNDPFYSRLITVINNRGQA